MRTDKLSAERIREILALVDELKASGVSAEAFAQSKGISYGQIRGWLSHTPRWRAQLAGLALPPRRSTFVRAQCSPPPAAAADGGPQPAHARITCEVAQRRAQIDWPVAHAAECAQWLRAWLG
ncbi:MAG: IS66 family insertion sequence element accessory protein TnpB [Thiomonas sp.]